MRLIRDDFTVPHSNNPPRRLRNIIGVGYKNERLAILPVQPHEHLHDFALVFGIKIARWLIRKE